ncbi:MAG: hypothetical protein ACRDGM_00945, partial [bacterium]
SNTYPMFRRLGDCILTGPTGNNLRDLYLLLEVPSPTSAPACFRRPFCGSDVSDFVEIPPRSFTRTPK